MEVASTYSPESVEDKWYKHWIDNDFFKSTPDDREPFTIVIPPPNVTGVLHMGHMLNNTIQDVLVRRARMQGKNACWVPGTDHASIATEAKVVNKLKDEGIDKNDLTRDEFMKHAWEWKEKHGGIILEQLKKLGASADWDRTRFTMEEDLSEAVLDVFVDLHKKGLIYRGVRMVNWDPDALTALSDEEVIHKEVNSKLYHIRYKIEDSEDDWIVIATTRPETILGDTAICVNPNDPRYAALKGKKAIVPLVGRTIPIIYDEYVDMEFGTGALKITPAHDENDYKLGNEHGLESINILNDDGTLSEAAQLYVGKDRFVVRKEIGEELHESGYLVKVEDHLNKVGFSERTDAVIEPKLSMQWFFKMGEISKVALDVVMDDTVKFHPAKFKNTYKHWMENIHDWCISRQLWWGQRIPAWYCENDGCHGEIQVSKDQPSACSKCGSGDHFRQDDDVLDTWFSSWLWPISVFDGFKNPDGEEINYYYPTNDLVTAPEILFFWVARMIMAGKEYRGEVPFKNVYLTGIVRDKLGRKMSKSLGNSPDPIDLIKKYSADGVRVGMLLCSPAGNDLPFDEQLCDQGSKFCNKIWNSFRLINMWEQHDKIDQPEVSKVAIDWFEAKYNAAVVEIEDHYSKFRISDALMSIYKLVFDDFCGYYLEMIKPGYEKPIDKVTFDSTIANLERILKMLHPFTPFITEEIWHLIAERDTKDCIIVAEAPQVVEYDQALLNDFDKTAEVVTAIRSFRKSKNISNKDALKLFVKNNEAVNKDMDVIIKKMCHLSDLEYVTEKVEGTFAIVVKSNEYFIPTADANVDVDAEISRIKDELKRIDGFLFGVNKKLSNEKFVAGAPEQVVAMEKKKRDDKEAQKKVLEETLANLTVNS